ncbi:MAG: hypothetical protein WCK57_06840 [Verrucomicrobiae bacterium]
MSKSSSILISLCAVFIPIALFVWFAASHSYGVPWLPFYLWVYGAVLCLIWGIYIFRRRWTLGLVCIVVALLQLYIARPVVWPYDCTPWAAHRARQNIGLVHPGMTAPQVWKTLGLSVYRFSPRTNGSGNPHAWPSNYLLWPGDILFCRWNLTTNPAVLLEAHFKSSLNDK